MRVARELGSYFDGHESVAASTRVECRAQYCTRVLDVSDDELPVRIRHGATLANQRAELVVVVVGVPDRPSEDGRVRGDTADAVPHHPCQCPIAQIPARQVVKPWALSALVV